LKQKRKYYLYRTLPASINDYFGFK